MGTTFWVITIGSLAVLAYSLFIRWCDDRELRRQHRMLRRYDRKLDKAEEARQADKAKD
ncbi:MAG: hypothetical protein ACYDDA_16170 [Acidiferrobacteraceae bacterium]